ncbi:hypothetical protein PybrP1_009455 [[Pythium] brassicae (nom. inval.)]|nr:hypothetical protein PybrP1_009455 [[Pythium] brassicae (nom. inval.)]
MLASSSPPPTPAGGARKLRVLCLHGFRTNTDVMRTQTQGMRDALGPHAEFVFVNGPFPSGGTTDEVILRKYGADAQFFEWWQVRYLDTEEIADLSAAQPKVWQARVATAKSKAESGDSENKWTLHFDNIEESLEYIMAQIAQHGPFDIALGFSQGAIMLTMLSMLYLKKQNVRPWRLCVCVCGVRVHGVNVRDLFETEEGEPVLVPYPSIHIAGKLDPLYDESLDLAAMYEDHPTGSPLAKLVIETDSGHKFPTPARFQAFYQELATTILQFFEHSASSSLARL